MTPQERLDRAAEVLYLAALDVADEDGALKEAA